MTSISNQSPVLKSTNQYDVLWDLTDTSLDTGAADPRTAQLAKHSASSSSQVKAVSRTAPTIVPLTLTAAHQSRPSLGTAAVTNA